MCKRPKHPQSTLTTDGVAEEKGTEGGIASDTVQEDDETTYISSTFRLFTTANMQRIHANRLSSAYKNRMLCVWLPPLDEGLTTLKEGQEQQHDTFNIVCSLLEGVHGGRELALAALAFHRHVLWSVQTGSVQAMDGFKISFRTLCNAVRSARCLIAAHVPPPQAAAWALQRAYLGQVPSAEQKADLLKSLAYVMQRPEFRGPEYQRLTVVEALEPWEAQSVELISSSAALLAGVRAVLASMYTIELKLARTDGERAEVVSCAAEVLRAAFADLVTDPPTEDVESLADTFAHVGGRQVQRGGINDFARGIANVADQTADALWVFVQATCLTDAHLRLPLVRRVLGLCSMLSHCLGLPAMKVRASGTELDEAMGEVEGGIAELRHAVQRIATGADSMLDWYKALQLDRIQELQRRCLSRLQGHNASDSHRAAAWTVQSQLASPLSRSYRKLRQVLHFLCANRAATAELMQFGAVVVWHGLAWDTATSLPKPVVFGDGQTLGNGVIDEAALVRVECGLTALNLLETIATIVDEGEAVLSSQETADETAPQQRWVAGNTAVDSNRDRWGAVFVDIENTNKSIPKYQMEVQKQKRYMRQLAVQIQRAGGKNKAPVQLLEQATKTHSLIQSLEEQVVEQGAKVRGLQAELATIEHEFAQLKQASDAQRGELMAHDSERKATLRRLLSNVQRLQREQGWESMLQLMATFDTNCHVKAASLLARLRRMSSMNDGAGSLSLPLCINSGLRDALSDAMPSNATWPELPARSIESGSVTLRDTVVQSLAEELCVLWCTVHFAADPQTLIGLPPTAGFHVLPCPTTTTTRDGADSGDRTVSRVLQACATEDISIVVPFVVAPVGATYGPFSLLVIDRRHQSGADPIVLLHHYTSSEEESNRGMSATASGFNEDSQDVQHATQEEMRKAPHTWVLRAVKRLVASTTTPAANVAVFSRPLEHGTCLRNEGRAVVDPVQSVLAVLCELNSLDFEAPAPRSGPLPLRLAAERVLPRQMQSRCQSALRKVQQGLGTSSTMRRGLEHKILRWTVQCSKLLEHATNMDDSFGECEQRGVMVKLAVVVLTWFNVMLPTAQSIHIQQAAASLQAKFLALKNAIGQERIETWEGNLNDSVNNLIPSHFAAQRQFQRQLKDMQRYELTVRKLKRNLETLVKDRSKEVRFTAAATNVLVACLNTVQFIAGFVVHTALHPTVASTHELVAANAAITFKAADEQMMKLRYEFVQALQTTVAFRGNTAKPVGVLEESRFDRAEQTAQSVLGDMQVTQDMRERNGLYPILDGLDVNDLTGGRVPHDDTGSHLSTATGEVDAAVRGLLDGIEAAISEARGMTIEPLHIIRSLTLLQVAIERLTQQGSGGTNQAVTSADQLHSHRVEYKRLRAALKEYQQLSDKPRDALASSIKHLEQLVSSKPVNTDGMWSKAPTHTYSWTISAEQQQAFAVVWATIKSQLDNKLDNNDNKEVAFLLKETLWQRCFERASTACAQYTDAPPAQQERHVNSLSACLSALNQSVMTNLLRKREDSKAVLQAYINEALPGELVKEMTRRRNTLLVASHTVGAAHSMEDRNAYACSLIGNVRRVQQLTATGTRGPARSRLSLLNLYDFALGMHHRKDAVDAAVNQFVADIPVSLQPITVSPTDMLCIVAPNYNDAVQAVLQWQLKLDQHLSKPQGGQADLVLDDFSVAPAGPSDRAFNTGLSAFVYQSGQGLASPGVGAPVGGDVLRLFGGIEQRVVQALMSSLHTVLSTNVPKLEGDVLGCVTDSLPTQLWIGLVLADVAMLAATELQSVPQAVYEHLKLAGDASEEEQKHQQGEINYQKARVKQYQYNLEQVEEEWKRMKNYVASGYGDPVQVIELEAEHRRAERRYSAAKRKLQTLKADFESVQLVRGRDIAHDVSAQLHEMLQLVWEMRRQVLNSCRGSTQDVPLPGASAASSSGGWGARLRSVFGRSASRATTARPPHGEAESKASVVSMVQSVLDESASLDSTQLATLHAQLCKLPDIAPPTARWELDRWDTGFITALTKLDPEDPFYKAAQWVAALIALATRVTYRSLGQWNRATTALKRARDKVRAALEQTRAARQAVLDIVPPIVRAACANPRADAGAVVSGCKLLVDKTGTVQTGLRLANHSLEGYSVAQDGVHAVALFVEQVVFHATDHVLRRQMVPDERTRNVLERLKSLSGHQVDLAMDEEDAQSTDGSAAARIVDDVELTNLLARLPSFGDDLLRLVPQVALQLRTNAFAMMDAVNKQVQQLSKYALASSFCVKSFLDKCIKPFLSYNRGEVIRLVAAFGVWDGTPASGVATSNAIKRRGDLVFTTVLRHLAALGSVNIATCSPDDLIRLLRVGADGNELLASFASTTQDMCDCWLHTLGTRTPDAFVGLAQMHTAALVKEVLKLCVRKASLHFVGERRKLARTSAATLKAVGPRLLVHAPASSGTTDGVRVAQRGGQELAIRPLWEQIRIADMSHVEEVCALLQAALKRLPDAAGASIPPEAFHLWFDKPRLVNQMLPEAVKTAELLLLLLLECSPRMSSAISLASQQQGWCSKATELLHKTLADANSSQSSLGVMETVYVSYTL